jgi:hypothetical protein
MASVNPDATWRLGENSGLLKTFPLSVMRFSRCFGLTPFPRPGITVTDRRKRQANFQAVVHPVIVKHLYYTVGHLLTAGQITRIGRKPAATDADDVIHPQLPTDIISHNKTKRCRMVFHGDSFSSLEGSSIHLSGIGVENSRPEN